MCLCVCYRRKANRPIHSSWMCVNENLRKTYRSNKGHFTVCGYQRAYASKTHTHWTPVIPFQHMLWVWPVSQLAMAHNWEARRPQMLVQSKPWVALGCWSDLKHVALPYRSQQFLNFNDLPGLMMSHPWVCSWFNHRASFRPPWKQPQALSPFSINHIFSQHSVFPRGFEMLPSSSAQGYTTLSDV